MIFSERLVSIIRCPSCRGRLLRGDDYLKCDSCASLFPISRGVPILIDPEKSLFDPAQILVTRGTLTAKRGFRRLIPRITTNVASRRNFEELGLRLRELEQRPMVLVIGGGEGGVGDNPLRTPEVELVVTDVAIAEGTHLCADAHDLPFSDGSFDAVVAQAVLEHLLDPVRCVSEVHRVLKPGGLVYAETPFMQQVHMGAYDFTRFTPLGHRRLFRWFEELDSGVAVGPGSALAWALVYLFTSFAWNRASRRVLNVAARTLFFWLRFADHLLVHRRGATDAAGGVYFLGRRSSVPLSDRELIASYPGAI